MTIEPNNEVANAVYDFAKALDPIIAEDAKDGGSVVIWRNWDPGDDKALWKIQGRFGTVTVTLRSDYLVD